MNVYAYCANSFKKSVKKMAGIEPDTCPPFTDDTFGEDRLINADLIYFKLHGLPEQAYWYGDNMITALSLEKLRQFNLRNKIIFVSNCHLMESPMFQGLNEAGALAVIGGSGINYGGIDKLVASDILGLYFRIGLQLGMKIKTAFEFSKTALKFYARSKGVEDAMAFELYMRGKVC